MRQESVAELRCALLEAEVEKSLAEAMATIRVLKTASEETGSDLGLEKGYILGSLCVATMLPSQTDREKQPAEQECNVKVVQPTPTQGGG